jgi:ATP-dependent DNA helicase RecG
MDFNDAIRMVHFPDNNQDIDLYQQMRSEAHKRLIYDELFFLELGMALKKTGMLLETGIPFIIDHGIVTNFLNMLPFLPTTAQRRVIDEIHRDMASTLPMNRLLQGDVGSGKTVVAVSAMVIACANGFQAAMMAPTEILAEQHFRHIETLVQKIGIRCELLTGSLKTAEKKEILGRIDRGETQIIVGTHALIQEKVAFSKLGLVVIDEQHRFGVVQRATLRRKGQIPDVLIMTATPIPRTLAMTAYGDLDVSVIDELPPEKMAPKTKVFPESQRARVYEIIHREVTKGHQVFIVYPLVEASENLDLKDAVRMAQHLQGDIFPDLKIGLVHGRMKANEKEQVMNEFAARRINILVATTVIEVGIDIPAASLMVIEHAERFGLSQLHQLRGRVGRGGAPSYCILLVQKTASEDARKRLKIMEETNDGFRIAEKDLTIRGPGEFLGTRQSGLPDFKVANLARDGMILSEAKEDAFSVIHDDPRLENPENAKLREILMHRWKGKLEMAKTG